MNVLSTYENLFATHTLHLITGLPDLFHLGADGRLHFTDVHSDLYHLTEKGSPEFCIESQFVDQSSEEGSGGDYDDYEYSGVEEGTYDYDSYDETNPEYANSQYSESCQKGSKDSSIEIHYCAEDLESFFLDIRLSHV
jgi:hypothetical protein